VVVVCTTIRHFHDSSFKAVLSYYAQTPGQIQQLASPHTMEKLTSSGHYDSSS
jgi:hypothetical protein